MDLPEFLRKRAKLPRVEDPLMNGVDQRIKAGSMLRPDPYAKRPAEPVFELKQKGKPPHAEPPSKPPRAVHVPRETQKDLYGHRVELRPFNWYDQKDAAAVWQT